MLRSLGSAAVVQAGCAPHPRPCSTKAELGAELLCVPICLCHRWELQFGSAFNCELVCHGTAHRAVGSQGMGAMRGRGNWSNWNARLRGVHGAGLAFVDAAGFAPEHIGGV